MSDIAIFKSGLPAYLKNVELDEDTKAVAGKGGSLKRISLRGGVFRMIVDGEELAVNEDRAMPIVIVRMAHKPSRTFYAEAYKEGEKAAPACWSNDGDKPDASVEAPQASSCANCPQNIAGSGQGESRACRFSQRLAVVLADDVSGDIYQLTLPATSIFGKGETNKWPLQAYVKFMAGHGIPVGAAVTEMRFDAKATGQKLVFKPLRPLDQEDYETIRSRSEEPAALAALRMTVAQTDKLLPKPSAKIYAEVEQPETVVAAEESPSKRPSKNEKPVVEEKADKLNSILENWDDEE